MDVFEAIEKRHSVRDFDAGREVPSETVETLLQAACKAPTAGNIQPWRFCVVRRPDLKGELAEAALGQSFVSQAPVVIVVCADLDVHASAYGSRGAELYALQDCAAAAENILLCATALGLGSCWVGAFKEDRVVSALGLSRNVRPLALIPVGHAARAGSQPEKMAYERVTSYL
ncbi:MAG: hypothetical protein A2V52_02015 [Actinobacteria bacterium RBG_19FT_COMBO_54_7]|uniref:Nitroreductase domain-containing protein n=1 Tax=Candidatus Solincola sediminis TaxID=1797199 RepID=A0A1F2WIE5_9ACTN|nr:MAG: hypothetical protein A2Y75_08760 [Candidatus Solincola sediminis]OFW60703.1 MAG: hypothetical protein A2W01_08370 [Candidatus Solincola sediminis]OFW70006.1 MAG: hypothetical protein A2V52_02015 [Actinobacteria bacterium RBG_19FT_COMBO_54_7]